MAGESNRDLWQLITGRSVVHPVEFVGEELAANKAKLFAGVNYYKSPSQPSGEAIKSKKLESRQHECVLKLSQFLGLDEKQTYDVYCSYLMHEYRGSKQELQDVLNTERHLQQFVHSVRDYYFVERLYLLRCVKQLLSCWQETTDHFPYAEVYSDFVKPLYDDDAFISAVTDMYKDVCLQQAPTWQTNGNLMNDRQASVWLLQNLKEQCELLEIMFLYYKNVEHEAESMYELAAMCKRQGFGRRQVNKHLIDEIMDPVMSRIGFLQVMILIEGLDVEDLQERAESGNCREHHLIRHKKFHQLDTLMCSLGDIPPHGPLVLLWSLVHQMALEDDARTPVVVKKCGNRALELRVFQYLAACLRMEPFNGTTMVGNLCHSVLYGVLCSLLAVFDEATLGDSQGLYELTCIILKRPFLADDFWKTMDSEGLRSLLSSACLTFPLDAKPLLSLGTSLAEASPNSAKQVIDLLKSQQLFTEYLDKRTHVKSTLEPMCWLLTKQRRPYPGSCSLRFAEDTVGKILPGEVAGIVQWEIPYDAFDVFVGEIELLLSQVAAGAGMVEDARVDRVCDVCTVLHTVLESDVTHAQSIPQLPTLITLVNQVIHRFSQLSSPPLSLLASCIQVLTSYVKIQPAQVWHSMRQTGLLPFLTENIDRVAEIASGAGLNTGCYGRILAGLECTQGSYPVTMAILNLLSSLVQPLSELGSVNSLTPCVMMVTREIFPVFHKWRYTAVKSREKLGQMCLQVFHKILNLLGKTHIQGRERLSLRDVTVYSLLFTESGKTLLDIIGTGVDNVELALTTQGSASEGSGAELIQMIRLAFSVLNRLLLLRPDDAPPSPVEHSLSAQPANRSSQHVVAVVAQYMYHRHDTRLPTLTTLLLKRIAALFPMSVLACLANHAQPIRDVFLARLQAHTEDVRLKVGILELLSVCVETQPGLLEMFLNLTQVQPQEGGKNSEGKRDWSIGSRSCLHTILGLIEESKQGTYQCPGELLCAVLELIEALWRGDKLTAMTVLRDQAPFWPSLCLSLTRDMMGPGEVEPTALSKEVHTCANIMKILAYELYSVHYLHSGELDEHLDAVLTDLAEKKRYVYWSKYLLECMRCVSRDVVREHDVLSDNYALQLLLGYRNLLVVLAGSKINYIRDETKPVLLRNLLECLACQLVRNDVTALNVKLASVCSAAYLTLLKHWIPHVKDLSVVVSRLEAVFDTTCSTSELCVPSIQIGVVSAITHVLQHARNNDMDLNGHSLQPLVRLVCTLLQQTGVSQPSSAEQTQTKLQISCVYLLEELITYVESVSCWLPILKEFSTIQCLVTSLHSCIERLERARYVQCVLLLFTRICVHCEAAESVSLAGLTQHVCLTLSVIYTTHANLHLGTQATVRKGAVASEDEVWLQVYSLAVSLNTRMLTTLRYNFLQDALNFVGCHQQRIVQCLNCVGSNLNTYVLSEAIHTLRFISQVAEFRKQWFLHLPDSLQALMSGVCMLTNRCVSLLIRPRILQHMIQRGAKAEDNMDIRGSDKGVMAVVSRRLSRQSSVSDDLDMTSTAAQLVQQELLQILACCLSVLKHFSPGLHQILLDQSLDISEYEPLLEMSFSTPGLEQDAQPSFGTLLSATDLCVKLLAKLDGRGGSPNRLSPEQPTFRRSLVVYVMENTLVLAMSQAVRYLKHPALSVRDKQLLKRELATELNSIIAGMNRHLRKVPSSPGGLVSPSSSKQSLHAPSQDNSFIKLLQTFVSQVLT